MLSIAAVYRKYIKHLGLRFILLVVLFGLAIWLFAYIAHELFGEDEDQFDQAILTWFSDNVISPRVTVFMKTVTNFASVYFMLAANALLVLIFVVLKNWIRMIEVLTISVGGFLINFIMKIVYQRPRPLDPLIDKLENFSFPSGHATSGFIFYGLLAYLLLISRSSRRLKYPLAVLLISFSLLIGFSRIYLRVHYPSDVLAGLLVGFAWLIANILVFEKIKTRKVPELATTEKLLLMGKTN